MSFGGSLKQNSEHRSLRMSAGKVAVSLGSAVLTMGMVAGLVLTLTGCNRGSANLSSDEAKANYAMGLEMGQQAKKLELKIDESALMAGLKDGSEGKDPQVPRQDIMNSIMKIQEAVMQKLKAKGEEYLAKNKTKEGVKTTTTGLQYEVVKEGTGAQPVDGDEVTVHYTGTLVDGTKFDSSRDRNEPAKFNVNQVIPGWTEAIKLMKVGANYKLTIPSELGYGARGAGPAIPPHSVLLFDVELLDTKKGAAPAAPKGDAKGDKKKKG